MEKLRSSYHEILEDFSRQRKESRRLWNIGELTGVLLYNLILIKNPRLVLELGTSNGYSTFWMAAATLETGNEIVTIEIDPKRIEMAKMNLRPFPNITFINEMINVYFEKVELTYDFVFIDANKKDYLNYIRALIPHLEHRSLIVADNSLSHRESIKNYLDFLYEHSSFESVEVDVDSGLLISIYNND